MPAPVPVQLRFLSAKHQLNKHWVWQQSLEISNILTIPIKVLKVNEQIGDLKVDEWPYRYYIEVEECMDVKEWDRAVRAFQAGIQSDFALRGIKR